MEEFGKLRMTLLDEEGGVIDIYDIPEDDLFRETLEAFEIEAYDTSANKVSMVRFDFKEGVRGYKVVPVDEFFPRFISSLIEEFEEGLHEDRFVREASGNGY